MINLAGLKIADVSDKPNIDGFNTITVNTSGRKEEAEKELAQLKKTLQGKIPDKEIAQIRLIEGDKKDDPKFGRDSRYRIEFANKDAAMSTEILRYIGVTQPKYAPLFDKIEKTAPKPMNPGPLGMKGATLEGGKLLTTGVTSAQSEFNYTASSGPRNKGTTEIV